MTGHPYVFDPQNAGCSPCQRVYVTAGNPDLKPDEARRFSAGAVADLGPYSLSLDWFRIEIFDAPGTVSAQSILDLEAEGKPLPPATSVERGDAGAIDSIRTERVNGEDQCMAGRLRRWSRFTDSITISRVASLR